MTGSGSISATSTASGSRRGSTPRISDVAAAAGVSLGTVSNVLNRPDIVAPSTRNRVLATIDELGFVRNESARQLRAGSSRAIGLVVLDIANPFYADVARGVERAVDRMGGVVLVGNSAGDATRERRYLELFEEQRVRGVLIAPIGEAHPDVAGLRLLGIPIVLLDRVAVAGGNASVFVDDVRGGELAAQHLLDRGHRTLCFVGGPVSQRQVRERHAGALRVVAAVPGAGMTTIATTGLTIAAGRAAASQIVRARARPTAVFAANDLLAIGMLQGLIAEGVRVPDDVALIGFDDIEFAAAATVPLSSIRQPRAELGERGADLLFRELARVEAGEPPEHEQVRFVPELVVRASSG